MSSPQDGQSSIARHAGLIAAGTLTSRVLGLLRDMVVAAVFSVRATDAFWVAFTIPNALRVLLGEGAIGAAIVPVLSEVRSKEGESRATAFFANLTGAMGLVLALVAIAGVLLAPWLVQLYAGGYDEERLGLTVQLTRIVFPYIFLMGVAALATGALNTHRRFAAPAFAPALLNIALVGAVFALVPVVSAWGLPPITALAVGALIGGTLHVSALALPLRATGMLRVPRFDLADPYVRKAFRLLAPLLAGLGVYQLNIMLSRLFASFLADGAQSYLYYGQRLVESPQGVFSLAIATAALPALSDLRNRGDEEGIRRTFSSSLRLSLFVAIPATVALVLLAEPTVATLFGRGQFGAEHVHETARSLVWQAAGIWAVASVRTIVPMFYAYQDTRTPVMCSAVNLVTFVVVSLLLMERLEHVGIAMAFSAASVAQLAALLWGLSVRVKGWGAGEVLRSAARSMAAATVMGVVLHQVMALGASPEVPLGTGALLALAAVSGAVSYAGAAWALGSPELATALAGLRRPR